MQCEVLVLSESATARAIQAVIAAGIEGRVEIEPNGKIVIVIGKSAAQNFVVPIAANDNTWSDVDAA